MSANPKKFYSLEEYFALERESDIRYEYWNGEVFAMSGAQPNHNRIARNLLQQLTNQLEDGNCEAFGSDQRVKVYVGGPYLYPDISVACPKPEFESISGLLALVNPTLIVEVLSPTTSRDDMKVKFTQFQTIPTFQEYLMIESTEVKVLHYKKQPDGIWLPNTVSDLEATLQLQSINCRLPLQAIYKKVDFSLSVPPTAKP